MLPDGGTIGFGNTSHEGVGEWYHELGAMESTQGASRGERIKVSTEVRQEVQRVKSTGRFKRQMEWGHDAPSTKISANT